MPCRSRSDGSAALRRTSHCKKQWLRGEDKRKRRTRQTKANTLSKGIDNDIYYDIRINPKTIHVRTATVLFGKLNAATKTRRTTAKTSTELGIDDTSEEGVLVATNDLLVPAENILELIDLLRRKHGENFGLCAVRFRDFGFGLDFLGLGPVLLLLLLSDKLGSALDLCNHVRGSPWRTLSRLFVDLLPTTLLFEKSNDGRLLFVVVQDAFLCIVFENCLNERLAGLAFRLELARKGEAVDMV